MNAKFKETKLIVNQNEKEDQISLRLIEATDSIRTLIHTLNTPLEEKIAMEDQINKLSHESNCLLDIISNTSKKDYQKKLFLAYREFLKQNIEAVNKRITKV
jgi:hypothetical protein